MLQLNTLLDAKTGVEKLYQQEWPELSTRRRNIKEPAVSRPAELALEPPEQMTRKSESYAVICKKP